MNLEHHENETAPPQEPEMYHQNFSSGLTDVVEFSSMKGFPLIASIFGDQTRLWRCQFAASLPDKSLIDLEFLSPRRDVQLARKIALIKDWLFKNCPVSTFSDPFTQTWTGSSHESETGNETAPEERPSEVAQELDFLCRKARNEHFEDGMDSQFSRNLVRMIKKSGPIVVEELAVLILSGQINQEVASEALRWIGYMEHQSSYKLRRWLLEKCLFSSSSWIRDGALLGLSFLDDPHAVSYLRKAIEREKIEELKKDMQQALEQLENSH